MSTDTTTSTDTRKKSTAFRDVVGKKAAGDDVLKRIRAHGGRTGEGICDATIKRWAKEGLVAIETREPRGREHHRSRPIVAVRLTEAGFNAARPSS